MGNTRALKPIYLYDHLPGILAGFPAFLFFVIALLTLMGPYQQAVPVVGESEPIVINQIEDAAAAGETSKEAKEQKTPEGPFYNVEDKGLRMFNPHMLFWVGLAIMVVWYIAFRFNLPKSKFWMMFGLMAVSYTHLTLPTNREV